MTDKRDDENVIKLKARNRKRMRLKRQDPGYRAQERERNAKRMREVRALTAIPMLRHG